MAPSWTTKPRLLRAALLSSAFALAALAPASADGASPPRVFIEVEDPAARHVQIPLTRRLIALELADTDVPPPPNVAPDVAALHVRIITVPDDNLRVELWQLGQAHGARTISSRGSEQLRARRIALAVAELARQLRHRRDVEAARERQRLLAEQAERERARGVPLYGRVALVAGARGAMVGGGDMLLAGPTLAASLRLSNGAALELAGSYLAGGERYAGDASVRWFDVAIAPSYAVVQSTGIDAGVGLTAGVAAVQLEPGSDALRTTETETWSARAAAQIFVEPRLGRAFRLRVAPEAGVALRRPEIALDDGTLARPGALWLGVTLGVAFDPLAP